MELLVLLLLTPAILAQGYGKSNDPNDEPFLPIYPVYPYSPKLIKRGTERDTVTQLTPELYAPKIDAKDAYTSSFSSNYPRDPYYPSYNPYPKASASSASSYSYYNSLPYSYPTTGYTPYNSYSTPYTMPAPSYPAVPYSSSYPNYYYQPPYYYPNYYNQPVFPVPPLPPPGADYSSDSYSDSENGDKGKEKKGGDKRYKDNDVNQDTSGNHFVDGANYISGGVKDLDGQPSTYKMSRPQNQLEQVSDVHLKTIQVPVPKTTYRVVSVAGQAVGPDYPLPAPYVKAQQLEELMSQTWAKMLAQNIQQQAAQYSAQEDNKSGASGDQNDQGKDTQAYISVPNVIAKTGMTYIVNPGALGKLNPGPGGRTQTTLLKSIKYPPVPLTPGVYTAVEKPEKDQAESNEYENYENASQSQDYESLSQTNKNYSNDPGQTAPYPNQNFVTQSPRGYNYQYSGYSPSSNQQQSQIYKNNLEDVNFGSKTKKG